MRKTWFIDLDGTLIKHNTNDELDEIIKKDPRNSHKYEEILDGAKELLETIKDDCVIITPARD